MSEYQYYEFLAIDRPLSDADRRDLRAISTRAEITATSFTNHYEWGDFKGDPAELMERWFDLHLYLANWGARRLMIRMPERLVDRRELDRFIGAVDWVGVRVAGENLIVDIAPEEIEPGDDWVDGEGVLPELAPLRADLLAGDLRLMYLVWLMAVEFEYFNEDELEPMPGIGPITPQMGAFVVFFSLDADLVRAAAERSAEPITASPEEVRNAIAALSDRDKNDLLMRLSGGEPHVAADLRASVREGLNPGAGASPVARRTVGELRSRAEAIRQARESAAAKRAADDQRRQAEAAERARRARLDVLAVRGESVWLEIETEIERRNPTGYDKAAQLLFDLRTIADDLGSIEDFERRLESIRERHARKERFLDRLADL